MQPLSRIDTLREMGISPIWVQKKIPSQIPPEVSVAELEASSLGIRGHTEIGVDSWLVLEQQIASCRQCALALNRHQAVVGIGDRRPTWLFIGEGPGAEEDARGEPFVGQAGRLLDSMLAALGLTRGDGVYIANAVKCRPPGNRTPEPHEIAACKPYLLKQVELLQPKLIVLLGKSAAHSVLGEDRSLANLRQQRFSVGNTPVIVTYHPAYLLRNLPEKAKAWRDLLFARRCLLSPS